MGRDRNITRANFAHLSVSIRRDTKVNHCLRGLLNNVITFYASLSNALHYDRYSFLVFVPKWQVSAKHLGKSQNKLDRERKKKALLPKRTCETQRLNLKRRVATFWIKLLIVKFKPILFIFVKISCYWKDFLVNHLKSDLRTTYKEHPKNCFNNVSHVLLCLILCFNTTYRAVDIFFVLVK